MSRFLACVTLVLLAALPAAALPQGIASITVNDSSVSATVSLPLGLGADVILSFEDVTGLSLASLGISAKVVSIWDLATLLTRLPDGSLANGFPVLLRIAPPAAGGLSFRGVANLEIHTHNLNFTLGCPLRIFTAHYGEPFRDVTVSMGAGSYRARGTMGGFSEFLILVDLRPVNRVIDGKLDRLEELLDDYTGSMPSPLYDDLEARLEAARDDYERGATAAAIEEVDGFIALVQAHSGTDIPNVWRAARDVDNVAGYLRAAAMTLRFSLDLKRSAGL